VQNSAIDRTSTLALATAELLVAEMMEATFPTSGLDAKGNAKTKATHGWTRAETLACAEKSTRKSIILASTVARPGFAGNAARAVCKERSPFFWRSAMRNLLFSSLLIVLITGFGGAAFGEDCEQINYNIKAEEGYVDHTDPAYIELAERFGFDSFEVCWSQRAIGTPNGTLVLCWEDSLIIPNPFSQPVAPDLWGNPGVLHTKDGDIYFMAYSVSIWGDDGLIALSSLTRYEGGTGAYEGASGWTSDTPKKYPPSFWMQSKGTLCVPD
jgi:hypothetical protein